MFDQEPQQAIKNPVKLILVLVAAGVLALSIHVGMLLAGVPFPLTSPPPWAGWLNNLLTTITLLIVMRLALPVIGRLSLIKRTLLVFLVFAMIRETLRGVIMNGVVTGGWVFAFAALPEQILRALVLAAFVTIGARWATSVPRLVATGLVIASVSFGINKLLSATFAPLVERLSYLARPDAYEFPYPVEVMIPAYLTFAEAILGATLLARLIWPALPASAGRRILIMAALVPLIRGVAFMPFLFSFFMKDGSYFGGVLSYSQFTLEFIALGIIVGIGWERYGRSRPDGAVGVS